MNRIFVAAIAVIVLSAFCAQATQGAEPSAGELRPVVTLERLGATTSVWIETTGPEGTVRRHLLRETASPALAADSGADRLGRALFATWDESGERWQAYSRDGGATWSTSRQVRQEIRLRDGAVLPDEGMPDVPAPFLSPVSSRLFIVQFKTTSLPEWRDAVESLGATLLSPLPHNAHIVSSGADTLAAIGALQFVQRVEPFHPWYRIEAELRQVGREAGASGGAEERIRVSTFEWGPEAKSRVIEAAQKLGARVADTWPSGHILELWATPEQLRRLAAHDDVRWIDRWSEPEQDMDLVRIDSGADFVENSYGYCGQGVRGEVMDAGIQGDHPDFDGIVFHGNYGLDSHGTATYGIVFGNGDRDGDGDGKATGMLPCNEQGIFADSGEVTDRFAHTQELKGAPYEASFQSNSWGSSLTQVYNSYSEEMDDIIWRLDIAITQSQSNNGNRSSRPQAWAKNIISVGGIRHYETLDTSDDAWSFGASIGPAQDDRIKPDVSYWYDSIYTTATDSGYTPSFGGTSAATPETAGVLGLILQMWADDVWETDPQGTSVFEKQPHASTIKALLINNAQQYDFTGETHDLTRVHQGWGRPSAGTAHERAGTSLVVDEEVVLELDDFVLYDVAVPPGESEFKVTMVYPDPPGTTASDMHRINDVNLRVTSPSATVYHGNVGLRAGVESTAGGSPNGLDTVENVFVRNPQSGIWQVRVEAVEVNQDAYLDTPGDDVTFALVVTGGSATYTSGEGQVRFLQPAGACEASFPIRVRDGNVGSGSVNVQVWSDSEPGGESVVLTETVGGSGNYTGQIATSAGSSGAGDGVLTAADGDTLTVRYIDADDGSGGSNVERLGYASVDCSGPVITQVGTSDLSDVAVNVTWVTDEEANSSVTWGGAVPPTRNETRQSRVTAHSVRLVGLAECTSYHFEVGSSDPLGNSSGDDNGGAYYSFVTLNNTAGELHSCRAGRLLIEEEIVGCSDSVSVFVTDVDLNQNPSVVETVDVQLSSSTEPVAEWVTLVETGPNTNEFTGSISTGPGPAIPGDGLLQTGHDDLITGRYDDADDGTGNPAVSTDTAATDCLGSGFSGVYVDSITDSNARVNWTTTEETVGQVEWGTSPALGNIATSTTFKTGHSVRIGSFSDCDRIYFRVVVTDRYANVSVADVGGAPYEFNAYTPLGELFRDEFSTDRGWTLEGEWEIAAPQGLGTAPGDPVAAHTGTRVLGHDLTGLGANPGDYEPQSNESATSPVIDASGLSNARLHLERWLNSANGAIGHVEVKDGSGIWQTVWSSSSFGGHTDLNWTSISFSVAAYADGNPDFQIRFRQQSLAPLSNDAGWNVDLVRLRDSSLPESGACGGCVGAPSFDGLDSAIDDDPCADSGVTLGWNRATSWGSGSSGSYAVYRDTAPGFTPGPANLQASGISVRTWTDPSPPADVTLYYVVRAENNEICGGGPNNSGLVDGNLVQIAARNDTAQSAPGDVGDSVRLDPWTGADARLSWTAAPGAAAYRVYRSAAPDGGFVVEAEVPDLVYDDPGVLADGQTWYYRIAGVDACGNEGP